MITKLETAMTVNLSWESSNMKTDTKTTNPETGTKETVVELYRKQLTKVSRKHKFEVTAEQLRTVIIQLVADLPTDQKLEVAAVRNVCEQVIKKKVPYQLVRYVLLHDYEDRVNITR